MMWHYYMLYCSCFTCVITYCILCCTYLADKRMSNAYDTIGRHGNTWEKRFRSISWVHIIVLNSFMLYGIPVPTWYTFRFGMCHLYEYIFLRTDVRTSFTAFNNTYYYRCDVQNTLRAYLFTIITWHSQSLKSIFFYQSIRTTYVFTLIPMHTDV